jgi:hypothetical protein
VRPKFILAGLTSALAVGILSDAPALAFPIFWTDSTKTTPLRGLKTPPKLNNDVLTFLNRGPVTFSSTPRAGSTTVRCSDVELGASVVTNNGVEETALTVPFAVFENDRCTATNGSLAPTYFHTLPPWLAVGAAGTVAFVTKITVTGSKPPFAVNLRYTRILQEAAGEACVWTLENVPGVIENVTEGFVEGAPPNLTLRFPEVKVPVSKTPTGKGCPGSGTFSAEFFLDAASDPTDTAFVG